MPTSLATVISKMEASHKLGQSEPFLRIFFNMKDEHVIFRSTQVPQFERWVWGF